jgi:uncharacterized repeat protein (TIGR01451 family)
MEGPIHGSHGAARTPRWGQITSWLTGLLVPLGRRPLRLGLFVSLLVLGLTQAAWADAPDVKIKPEKPVVTAKVSPPDANGHITVELVGAWSWPTHGKNCNEDRAGAGVAVDWGDPKEPGNPLGATVKVGTTTKAIAVGVAKETTNTTKLNSVDNVVHPTENDTGSGVVADITQAQLEEKEGFKKWRGGCGVFTEDNFFKSSEDAKNEKTTKGKVAHGNFGKVESLEKDSEGNLFENPLPPASPQQGARLKHVYASASDLKTICAVMYDVHGGTNASKNTAEPGVGIPGAAQNVTAGSQKIIKNGKVEEIKHNEDNGVQQNAGTPTGNACPAVTFFTSTLATEAHRYVVNETTGSEPSDTATLNGGTTTSKGKITFRLFKEKANGECEGVALGESEVTVDKGAQGQTYGSGTANKSGSFVVTTAGPFGWEAVYSGDLAEGGKTEAATSECGGASETSKGLNIEVKKEPASQSVLTGTTATFEIKVKNTGLVDLENVEVKDLAPEASACEKTIPGVLKAGEERHYTCTTSALTNPFNNVAEACGSNTEGTTVRTVCDTSEAHVGIEELASEQDFKPADTASITVTPPTGVTAGALSGEVTFKLFRGSCVASHLIYEEKEPLVNGKAKTESQLFLSELLEAKGLSTDTEGTYNWLISYSGDSNENKPFTGTCGTEHFTVTNS